MLTHHANGKLLITGEYFVLDGALALAVPTQAGQQLTVRENDVHKLRWRSLDYLGREWFGGTFSIHDFSCTTATEVATAERLQQILRAIRQQQPNFLRQQQGYDCTTTLEFPNQWGLGSSSTLLSLLAAWAGVDPYRLLKETFGGSGYDIACATNDSAIFYQNTGQPQTEEVNFSPLFKENLFFVYLEKKQNSRSGIRRYRERADRSLIATISALSRRVAATKSYAEFADLLLEHERLVAQTVDLPRAQDLYFSDFQGVIKSLGAWGGDFVLAVSDWAAVETRAYFNQKGFATVVDYAEMVKHNFKAIQT